jgi:hypothetical protein
MMLQGHWQTHLHCTRQQQVVLGPQVCQLVCEGLHVVLYLVMLLTHHLQVAHHSPANTVQHSTACVGEGFSGNSLLDHTPAAGENNCG